jgi:hypothetical protein
MNWEFESNVKAAAERADFPVEAKAILLGREFAGPEFCNA